MKKHTLSWLPVVASLALVLLIVIVSGITIRDLKRAISWRRQTFKVVLEAQAYEDRLIDGQSQVRRYAANGKPNLLIEYKADVDSEGKEFKKLSGLAGNDPKQRDRLNDLHNAVKALFDYDDSVIGVYARQGASEALKMEEAPRAAELVDTAVKDLETFKNEEENLLDKRDTLEQTEYHRAAHVLIAGSIIAAALLVFSTFVARRELARRKRAEVRQQELIAELQKSLSEVRTLSGLIPICGWCKKVRSDQGFWQSVEHYVSLQTGAKFSHGMCPMCAKEWAAGIPKPELQAC